MKIIKFVVAVIAACIIGGCSSPYRLILHNRSDRTIVVELPGGITTSISPGKFAEFAFDELLTRAQVNFGDVKRAYTWRYPPKELMDETRTPRRFAAGVGADGRIYAEKMLSNGEVQTVPQQPVGFPLLPKS
jgi:hypothetical protein